MKIVINSVYGGFCLSFAAIQRLDELGYYEAGREISEARDEGFDIETYGGLRKIPRTHPLLIQVVEELGDKVNGTVAKLTIIEIPDDVKAWELCEYDGREHVAEAHRKWF